MVKGVISAEQAAVYAEKGEEWLEGFGKGYKRDDPATWDVKNLPKHNRGGLYSQFVTSHAPLIAHRSFSFAHAQFVWDCKSEPKIVELFEKLWGTEKLTVSFGELGGWVALTRQTAGRSLCRCRMTRWRTGKRRGPM